MKYFILLSLVLALAIRSYSGQPDTAKAELILLMNERKVLADEYYSSLEAKSGFFGNRTKNDLRDSQDKLIEIVKVDNKIMEALRRTLNYRNFEKLNMKYDVSSYEDRIRNLNVLNDTLTAQNERHKKEINGYKSAIRKRNIYLLIIILLLASAVYVYLRKKYR